MALSAKFSKFLKEHKLPHDVIEHKTVYTAYDLAQTTKMKLQQIAKTLLLKVKEPKAISEDPKAVKDTKHILAVLPAHLRVDLGKVKKLLNAKSVTIASEKEITKELKMKPGAQTPFGSHHGVHVVMDKALTKTTHALFGAGSFTESVKMKVAHYLKIEKPLTGDIGQKPKKK